MTKSSPILRLRAMVAEATRGPYAPSAGRIPKALLIRKDDGRLAIVAEGLSEEDAARIVASDRIARFIADPAGAEKEIRLLLYRIWDTRAVADAAQAICDLLAAVGVEHG